MARIAEVDRDRLDPYARKVFESQERAWGSPLLNHRLYARRPTIFRGAQGMWAGLHGSGLLPTPLVALLNRRVAALNGCVF
jgi:hypothetical protein